MSGERWILRSSLLMAMACGVAPGCTGTIGSDGPADPSNAGGAGSVPTTPGTPGVAPPIQGSSFIDPGSRALVRLTNAEYSQTVTDLLGEPPDAAARYNFPGDSSAHGFANNVDLLRVSTTHAEQYAAAADAIATGTFADPARRGLVLTCDVASGAPCLTTYVRTLGRRMFRRPVADGEMNAYVTLATKAVMAGDTNAGPEAVLEAMLQSPNFLYRVQIGVSDPRRAGFVGLTGFEMATRLSYFLFGSSPDDALLDQAQSGVLDQPAGVSKVVAQMLGDVRARRGVRSFYSQWLPLTEIAGSTADQERLAGDVTPGADMAQETVKFVDDVLWDSKGTVNDLLTARYTFVNASLAKVYGVAAPAGQDWQRIDLSAVAAGATRAGVLTQPSMLAAGSHGAAKPSNTRRGQMVREQLLCVDIPSPPPGVAANPPAPTAGETEQQTFAKHTTDPSCAACHTLMDPIGWGLSGFDGAGAVRSKDSNGQALSVAGLINGFAAPAFTGPVELGQKLAGSDMFKDCVARQLFRYAFARVELDADAAGIKELRGAFDTSRWDFPATLASLTESNGFRYHSKGDAP